MTKRKLPKSEPGHKERFDKLLKVMVPPKVTSAIMTLPDIASATTISFPKGSPTTSSTYVVSGTIEEQNERMMKLAQSQREWRDSMRKLGVQWP